MKRGFAFTSVLFFLSLNLYGQDLATQVEKQYQAYKAFGAQLFDGPNCYHSVAFLLNWTPRLSYMSAVEFEEHLKNAKCEELAASQALQAGDLGLVYSKTPDSKTGSELIHAFVWETIPSGIYSKTGFYTSFEFEKTNLKTLEKWFHLKETCLLGGNDNSQCQVFLKNFRCEFGKISHQKSKLDLLEQKLSSYVWGTRIVEDKDLSDLEKALKAMKRSSARKDEPLTLLRIDSMLAQIQMIRDPD